MRIATLNVRGYQRKKIEVSVTVLGHKVDVLALTETRSRTQGRVEGVDHDLWELGADKAEGEALLVHTGGQFTAEHEAVAEDVFVLTVRYQEKDLARVGVVYATPDRPEREVLDRLQDVVHGRLQQGRAAAPGVPRPPPSMGVHGLPHRVDMDVEGSGSAHP